jgi:hypothetical protein
VLVWLVATLAPAQIDPGRRSLVQVGYELPLHEDGPISAYAYYYWNNPHFLRTNLALRMAVAPVYLDAELGIRRALGEQTDVGVGFAGGGFADTYSEIRRGDFRRDESFTGHGAELSASVYHRFNPGAIAPLYGILRGAFHASVYVRDDATARAFDLPRDQNNFHLRTGLRWGGREPALAPKLAGELSAWYEGRFRLDPGAYGFGRDRAVHPNIHRFWGRALLAYTLPQSQNYFEIALTAGTSANMDRLGAYRLGGNLPLSAEFPLNIPGYHNQELIAREFALLSGKYFLMLDARNRFALGIFGSAGYVDYVSGLEQPGNFHSGVGGAVAYQSPSGSWQFALGYGFGIQALRNEGRGAHVFGVVAQYDLEAEKRAGVRPFWSPLMSPDAWRGISRIFGAR